MKLRLTAHCCLVLLLFSAPHTFAQTSQNSDQDWAALRQLAAGEKLRVETKDGRKLEGRLSSISDTELVLEHKGKITSFRQDELQKIWQVFPPSRTKQSILTAVGAGAGLIAGLAIAINLGFKQCGGSCADEKTGALAAVIGLPVGGGLLGRELAEKGKRALVYSTP